jgi:hypothetical protein
MISEEDLCAEIDQRPPPNASLLVKALTSRWSEMTIMHDWIRF